MTPVQRLRWLVEDFAARLNYSSLPSGETPADITREVSVFLLYQLGAGTFDMTEIPDLPAEIISKMAKDTDEGLDRFIQGEAWTLRIHIPVDRTIQRETGQKPKWRALTGEVEETVPLMFGLAVMDLLQTESWRPARCIRADCGGRFARDDRRQIFCSPRCSQTMRARRLRKKSHGRAGRKRVPSRSK